MLRVTYELREDLLRIRLSPAGVLTACVHSGPDAADARLLGTVDGLSGAAQRRLRVRRRSADGEPGQVSRPSAGRATWRPGGGQAGAPLRARFSGGAAGRAGLRRSADPRAGAANAPRWQSASKRGTIGATREARDIGASLAHARVWQAGAAVCERVSPDQGVTWPTICTCGKSHPPTDAMHRDQCKCQRSGGRKVLPGQGAGVRLGVRFQRAMPATLPGAGAIPGWWTGTLCCCVAVFCCCTRPLSCGLRISNLSL